MQLRLLEQQKRERLMMEREQQIKEILSQHANSANSNQQTSNSKQSIEDYRMQLMLLEQEEAHDDSTRTG